MIELYATFTVMAIFYIAYFTSEKSFMENALGQDYLVKR